ncbi:MAG TPA: fructosamine kinase family protein [Longimicrobiales bacterium]
MTQSLPTDLAACVQAVLTARAGKRSPISHVTPVGGGCIHNALRIETEAGDVAFVKWSPRGVVAPGVFAAEAAGLRALAAAGALRVPEVIDVFDPARPDEAPDRPTAWLLLEWLEPGSPVPGTWARLGRGLAALHRTRADRWGAEADNFIGTLPQPNGWYDDWPAYWRERRLAPQLRLAYDAGYFGPADRRRFDRLLDTLDDALAGADACGASLLHGDLWSGNVHVMAGGEPALVDPACYHGHREVDLAMAELFGGLPAEWLDAYAEAWPLEPGYRPRRRAVYQLYYLLVHVNLFGAAYVGGALRALGEAGV